MTGRPVEQAFPAAGTFDRPRFMQPGHQAGELVQARTWTVREQAVGSIVLNVPLPEAVRNPFGELFGGFTGLYVDMAAIYAVWTLHAGKAEYRRLATVNMHIDYLHPVRGPQFVLQGEVLHAGRSTCLVLCKMFDDNERLLVHALTTMKKQA